MGVNVICKAYFLDFVKDDTRKMSYAASLGVDRLPAEYVEIYRKLLVDFDYISTRESEGAEIVSGLLGHDVPVVLDPTLLMPAQDWVDVSAHAALDRRPYVLLYLLAEDSSLFDFARELSDREGIDVIYVSDRLVRPRGVTTLTRIAPLEWVALFSGARYVITNSYHGIAFAAGICN